MENNKMPDKKDFLTPRLEGRRFVNDKSIPLDLFEDFAAMEKLLIDLAKKEYIKDNIGRERVPKGFDTDVILKLSDIDDGSSIPKIILAFFALAGKPNPNIVYYERAKMNLVRAIDAAHSNKPVTEFIPKELLGRFAQIGKNLLDDESMNFSYNGDPSFNAIVNKSSRRNILLQDSTDKEFTEDIMIVGVISGIELQDNIFNFLIGGNKIEIEIPKKFKQTVLDAIVAYDKKAKVQVVGSGTFSDTNKLLAVAEIKDISILDPLDVNERLRYLLDLKEGWLNGNGAVINKEGSEWFGKAFENYFDIKSLPLPYIFPTITGGIQLEWAKENYDISITVDLTSKNGDFHYYNFITDKSVEQELDLSSSDSWDFINTNLQAIIKDKK